MTWHTDVRDTPHGAARVTFSEDRTHPMRADRGVTGTNDGTQTWIGDVLSVPSGERPVVRPALLLIQHPSPSETPRCVPK